ncbi:MAG TPA: hemerythrin domain-containing protein [Dehalococcoidia bacterium]
MNALDVLKQDHDKVKDLFRQYEQTEDPQQRGRIARQVFQELEIHTKIEEEIFYPALREQGDTHDKEMVAESFEEHHLVDTVIGDLRGLNPGDLDFNAKFHVLMENVQHHIQEEEQDLFPDARQRLGGQLDMLGQRLMERKQQLQMAGG